MLDDDCGMSCLIRMGDGASIFRSTCEAHYFNGSWPTATRHPAGDRRAACVVTQPVATQPVTAQHVTAQHVNEKVAYKAPPPGQRQPGSVKDPMPAPGAIRGDLGSSGLCTHTK